LATTISLSIKSAVRISPLAIAKRGRLLAERFVVRRAKNAPMKFVVEKGKQVAVQLAAHKGKHAQMAAVCVMKVSLLAAMFAALQSSIALMMSVAMREELVVQEIFVVVKKKYAAMVGASMRIAGRQIVQLQKCVLQGYVNLVLVVSMLVTAYVATMVKYVQTGLALPVQIT